MNLQQFAALLLLLSTSSSSSSSSFDVFSSVQDWCSSFVNLGTFSDLVARIGDNHVESQDAGCSEKKKKILSVSDLADFQHYGKRDEAGLPHGAGKLVEEATFSGEVISSTSSCLRGVCARPIANVEGNFIHGLLEGPAAVRYRDGGSVIAQFKGSVLNGLAVEFDPEGRQRYLGRFSGGRRAGRNWYMDPRCGVALTGMVDSEGKFSGRDFLYLLADTADTSSSPVLALRCTVKNGAILDSERVEVVGGGATEGGILKLETADWPEEDEYGAKSFSLWHPGLTELEEVVLMQATRIKLILWHLGKPFSSVWSDPSATMDSLVDPAGVPRGFDDGRPPSSCDETVRSAPLKEGSLNEHTLVSAQGSGSKFVLTMLDLSTGVQSYIDAVAVLTPRYRSGAGLFVKTHHQRLQHASERRRREDPQWRSDSILRGCRNGAVLLLRNPYEAIVSHWSHRRAGTEVDQDKDVVASLRTREFGEFAELELKIWSDIALDWLSACPRLLVVHYEKFVQDPVAELRKVHEFLNFPVDEARMKCIGRRPPEFFRRKKTPVPSSVFTPGFRSAADRAIEEVQEAMAKAAQKDAIPLDLYKHTDLRSVTYEGDVLNSLPKGR